MHYIIGSGLVGMAARWILGDKWQFIPQGRSRYFSFDPALADDFITVDKAIDPLMEKTTGLSPAMYKRAFSVGGQLICAENESTIEPYLYKVYGDNKHHLADKLVKTSFFIYDVSAKQFHDGLQGQYLDEIKKSKSKVVSIDIENRVIEVETDGEKTKRDYETIINTAPLDALLSWSKQQNYSLDSKTVCFYYITTGSIDLEGANQALVCDSEIDFFKVTSIGQNSYLFWSMDEIEDPHKYFGSIIGYDLDILEVFRIEKAMPLGSPPDLTELEENGIYCVGSNAQWDDFMDVSSCLNRLLKLRNSLGVK